MVRLKKTIRSFSLICTISILSGGALIAQQSLRIVSVDPTVLFPTGAQLQQLALLHVENVGKQKINATVSYAIEGKTQTVNAVFNPGGTEVKILVPDIAAPAELTVNVLGGPQNTERLATWNQIWKPERKWKVFVVMSSHEDLGYEGTIFQKTHDNANWIDIGKQLSDPKFPIGGHRGYHYDIETLVGARNYVTERGERAWRDLVNNEIKDGNMSLLGAPSGVHTHWMDYEELARMTYPARREFRDRYGLDIKTFMIVDNPSLSWSGAQVLAEAGFKYVARWGQSFRSGGNNDYAHTKLPAIFWWKTPDGMHRILFAWRSHYYMPLWYGQGPTTVQQVTDVAAFEVSKDLKNIEAGEALGPYPYDAVAYPQYYDHEVPHEDRALSAWNKQFKYPHVEMVDPTVYFEYMEAKYGKQIPVESGDLNNFSADYATIDPQSQGWKRAAARALPFSEGMHAIAAYLNPQTQPVTNRVSQDYTLLYNYDEHSWPTSPNPKDIHVFNANYVKKATARRVNSDAQSLLQSSLQSLAEHIPNPTGRRSVVVWNSLAHERSDPVTLRGYWGDLVDTDTGKRVRVQLTGNKTTVFLAPDVPAYGYKVFRVAGPPAPVPEARSGYEMENDFYRIRVDRTTGNIISIFDKKQKKELVDRSSKYQFNQFVTVHKNGKESLDGTEHMAGTAKSIMVTEGTVYKEIQTNIDDPQTGAAITQTIRLYAGLPRIDLKETVRHAGMMLNTSPAERYKDNIFYAFPLNVPGGQPRAEYPGGVVRPYYDQLRWGSHDFLSANRWVNVSTNDFGVTIAPWNEQIFEFGGIRYNEFSVDYKPANSHIFAYVWSNRMTGLLNLGDRNPMFTVGYSITSHAGDWNSGAAAQLGWSVASPLRAEVLPARARGKLDAKQESFFSIDAPNVQMTVLKESEQPGRGWVVRMVETAGRETDAVLSSHLLPVRQAFGCDLTEDDQSSLPIEQNKIHVHLLPFGISTVRLVAGKAPAAVRDVTAKALSGERTALEWAPVLNADYNVYRSTDPEDPPTAYSLVARVTTNRFEDDHLMPMGTYYYHVAAVSNVNVQGQPSNRVEVTTLATNHEPPPPVTGLTVIALTGGRRMVAWDKSPATDVRDYIVYRSMGNKFNLTKMQEISAQHPSGYSVETYIDRGCKAEEQCQYFVQPVDWAGNQAGLPSR